MIYVILCLPRRLIIKRFNSTQLKYLNILITLYLIIIIRSRRVFYDETFPISVRYKTEFSIFCSIISVNENFFFFNIYSFNYLPRK